MDTAAVARSLELAAERVGDPGGLIYARLFAQSPELEPLFVLDRSGAVRNEMVRLCFDAILDLCDQGHYARGLFSTEVVNHQHNGIAPAQFQGLFAIVRDVVREANGADWTAATDAAWHAVLARVEALMRDLAPAG